jgi:glutamate-5-semialdehyde dehydrogenase
MSKEANDTNESRESLAETAARVRRSARSLASESAGARDDALRCMASALLERRDIILEANARDVSSAESKDLDAAFVDRLRLDPERIASMASALEELVALPDPLGRIDEAWRRPNGLEVGRKRIPLGVIGMIYESRPNVTSDAAGLCLKSGNGVILKGGSDAFESNRAVYRALCAGLEASSLREASRGAIGFVDTTERSAVREMLGLDASIDVIIPRGGRGLIDFVREHSRIPVIKHDEGVCHIVVDRSAAADDVDAIVLNAKTQRPGVCNAVETLLVLEDAVDTHLARLLGALVEAGVTLHLDPRAMEVASAAELDAQYLRSGGEEAWRTEFLALELAVRVVADLDEAIDHIATYGSRHTESLLTGDYHQGRRFLDEVDSSVVLVNASTRFADGGQLGLGAEIGISTTRMHAYGPMGLRELTTTKFVVRGDGQIRT